MSVKKVRTITVSLPEPCAEDWEQMKPMGCGRFCQQCQKTVIDFTVLSDDMVARLLGNAATGQLCGRFEESQLNRPMVLPAATAKKSRLRQLGAAAFFLAPYFSTMPATAQEAATTTASVKDTAASSKPFRIKGRITDALTGNPMIRMEISIEGLDKQYSDRFGRFSFTLPADWAGRQVILKAAYRPLSTAPKENTVILEETVTIESGKEHYTVELNRYPMGKIGDGAADSYNINVMSTISERPYRTHGGTPVMHTTTTIRKYSFWQKITKPFRPKKRR